MFINHTNHPSHQWSAKQMAAAKQYGDVVDMPFPEIEPTATSEDISQEAQRYAARIISLNPSAVLCQGEFTYCYALVERLLDAHIPVLAATSERVVDESYEADIHTKIVNFQFVQFREYSSLK